LPWQFSARFGLHEKRDMLLGDRAIGLISAVIFNVVLNAVDHF
jgi:hypothetical protein